MNKVSNKMPPEFSVFGLLKGCVHKNSLSPQYNRFNFGETNILQQIFMKIGSVV